MNEHNIIIETIVISMSLSSESIIPGEKTFCDLSHPESETSYH